mmetsp:Transcript_89869/g.254667  ORF Transcript_89869/g.254667 Transcript_89869/m.254667 type:complete len:231 (+) Transcript_89869:26-718(+)
MSGSRYLCRMCNGLALHVGRGASQAETPATSEEGYHGNHDPDGPYEDLLPGQHELLIGLFSCFQRLRAFQHRVANEDETSPCPWVWPCRCTDDNVDRFHVLIRHGDRTVLLLACEQQGIYWVVLEVALGAGLKRCGSVRIPPLADFGLRGVFDLCEVGNRDVLTFFMVFGLVQIEKSERSRGHVEKLAGLEIVSTDRQVHGSPWLQGDLPIFADKTMRKTIHLIPACLVR